jgi:hypothetical protein
VTAATGRDDPPPFFRNGRRCGERLGWAFRERSRGRPSSPIRQAARASAARREVGRHGGRAGYRAAPADAAAWQLARRPTVCKLAAVPRLRTVVAEQLRQDWSPEQLAGRLRQTFPGDEQVHVSHETIYRSLFIEARGVPKQELPRHVRSQGTLRRARTATRTGQRRGRIVGRGQERLQRGADQSAAAPGATSAVAMPPLRPAAAAERLRSKDL